MCQRILSEIITPKLSKDSDEHAVAAEMIEQLLKGDYTFNIDSILEFISTHTGIQFGIGAEAILELLKKIDLDKEISALNKKMTPGSASFSKDIQRFKILN
jgi:DNA-directed RNA polymerase subunit beta'